MVAALLLVALWWNTLRVPPLNRALTAEVTVSANCWYAVSYGEKDTLLLSVNEAMTTDWKGNASHTDSAHVTGFYISRKGYVLTSDSLLQRAPEHLNADTLRARLLREVARLETLAEMKAEHVKELNYYARTHSVVDEGYNDVMAYKDVVERQAAVVDSCLEKVRAASVAERISATLCGDVSVGTALRRYLLENTESDSAAVADFSIDYKAQVIARKNGLLLLQNEAKALPKGVSPMSLFGRVSLGEADTVVLAPSTPENYADALPFAVVKCASETAEGAAVVDAFGAPLGMIYGGKLLSVSDLRQTARDMLGRFGWWSMQAKDAAKALFSARGRDSLRAQRVEEIFLASDSIHASLKGSTTLESAPALPRPSVPNVARRAANLSGFKCVAFGDSIYLGQVVGNRPQGYGTLRLPDGARCSGFWNAGELAIETNFTDTTGIYYFGKSIVAPSYRYQGDIDAERRPHGVGVVVHRDGTYYAGRWRDGKREGFGFAVGQKKMVRAGVWHENQFRGEQMIFTADRVFGIDISRYQHEIGRKKYGIDFSNLRITSLGALNAKRIRGNASYPVRFVYVKATQGTTIKSKYYAADAAACRRNGIAVGAYHFFSTKRGGIEQANYFLAVARPQNGDLAPVLDVEPYDSEIKAMGGADAMFREIVAWVRKVRAYCATNPVLYVSQSFVNKYWSKAPAELEHCHVWIARYGEYKPYVHLLHWQLTPYGRVAGIKGEVDVNVFNGNLAQFQEYLSVHHVRR